MTTVAQFREAAARLLAAGDPVGALKYVGTLSDPESVALRGIALAQLGDYPRARELLQEATAAFGTERPVVRARCVAADAEVALAARDPNISLPELEAAGEALVAGGDTVNAAYAELVLVRAWILFGRIDDAHRRLDRIRYDIAPTALVAVRHLLAAEVAIRRVEAGEARRAVDRARAAARGIPALEAEATETARLLEIPAARLVEGAAVRAVTLPEVERILAGDDLVVDACRQALREGDVVVSFARRGTLFALLTALARAGPDGVSREALFEEVFEATKVDDSHRARLRTDSSRLRKAVAAHATITATATGFAMKPRHAGADRRAAPTDRGRPRERVGAPRGRGALVDLGARDGAGHQPAHGPAGAGRAGGRGAGHRDRARPRRGDGRAPR